VKVGVVGSGSIARRHLSNLLALGYSDLVVVSEKKKLNYVVIAGSAIPCVTDYEQLLNSSAECIIICNPTSMHEEYLRRALEVQKHVLLEKPAAIHYAGLTNIMDRLEQEALTVGLVHQFRFDEGISRLRDYLQSGNLGEVLHVSALQGEHIADYHPDEDYRQSYAARRDLGGGVLLTQIHQIDLLNWLFGPFDSVYAVGGNSGRLQIDVEDQASYLLKSTSGLPVHGYVDYLSRPKTMKIRVSGTCGVLEWDYYQAELSLMHADETEGKVLASWAFDRDLMFRRLLEDYFNSVANKTRPRSNLFDGICSLKIVESIKGSMTLGRAERID